MTLIMLPTKVLTENQSAITIAKNPVFHTRMKHINIQYYFIHEKVEAGLIELVYYPIEDMLADVLTKLLVLQLYKKMIVMMGLEK